MYNIDKIKIDKKPREEVLKEIPESFSNMQMNKFDSSFICGMLEKYKPNKILEIGVLWGGTTAIVLKCMKKNGRSFEMHSVDIETKKQQHSIKSILNILKRKNDSITDIGWLGKKAAELYGIKNWHLWCGNYIPSIIEKIGDNIDFVILDTMHVLPGEVLEFLAIFPYLSNNAIVCFHDIRQNHKQNPDPSRIATNALFNSVVAEKYINNDSSRKPDGYPNIGAIRVNKDTKKYINNVIGVLTQNWSYILNDEILDLYRNIIEKHYSKESLWLFDKAVMMNINSMNNKKR